MCWILESCRARGQDLTIDYLSAVNQPVVELIVPQILRPHLHITDHDRSLLINPVSTDLGQANVHIRSDHNATSPSDLSVKSSL